MEYKRFENKMFIRIDKGEEIVSSLKKLYDKENIRLASFNIIGAVDEVEIGHFHTEELKYYTKKYTGIYEIGSMSGDASINKGEVHLHIHCVLSELGGSIIGGHLISARVSLACEVFLDIVDGEAGRKFSDELKLPLISFK